MRYLLLFILSVSTAIASPREEAEALLNSLSEESSIVKKMDLASSRFLGLPYGKNGPLGEGPQGRYDQDPLYRFDTFDCTTFVETIVSLALARNTDDFEMQMDKIRYENADVDYLKRNHFPSLQWIPNNVSNGLLREINDSVVSTKEQKIAEAVINLPGWLKKIKIDQLSVPMATSEEKEILIKELNDLASSYSPIVAKINYIPIDYLVQKPALLKRIPHGSIVNMVRPNWDLTEAAGTHMNVSHQGFLFRKNKVLYLRHASTTGSVLEQPFIDYLKKFVGHATLKGIHLMKVSTSNKFLIFKF